MPVHFPTGAGAQASFIVCDKRSDINRVMVPAGRLIQWQCSAALVCEFVAAVLGLRRSREPKCQQPVCGKLAWQLATSAARCFA